MNTQAQQRLDLFNQVVSSDLSKARAVFTSVVNTLNKDDLDEREEWEGVYDVMRTTLNTLDSTGQSTLQNDPAGDMVLYDKSAYTLSLPEWSVLNADNLPYPLVLRDILLPSFHPMPHGDIQYPVLAACMLVNSNSLPDDILNARYYVHGASGSGKTTLCKRWETHYFKNSRCRWMPGSTGTQLAESIHSTVYVDGDLSTSLFLRPGLAILNNVTAELQKRLQHQYAILLATELENAFYARSGQDKGTFYTHSTLVLNGVDSPFTLFALNPELRRRTLVFSTEPATPLRKHGAYNWGSVANEYRNIWHYKNVGEFYATLSKLSAIPNDISNVMSPDEFEASRTSLATGVYTRLFSTIDEGIATYEKYWQYLHTHVLSGSNDPLYTLLVTFLEETWLPLQARNQLSFLPVKYVLDYVRDKSQGIVAPNSATMSRIVAFFADRQYQLRTTATGLAFNLPPEPPEKAKMK